ncbi:MAG: hypothetical protein VCA38_06420 [Roseibacillus sp.]
MKLTLPNLLIAAVVLPVTTALSGVICISMTDPGGQFDLAPDEIAGVVPSPNWNNVPYTPNENGTTKIAQVIHNSSGEATSLGLSYRAWDGRNASSIHTVDANSRMMKGKGPSPFDSSSDPHPYAAIELTGCHAAAGEIYDVYIYIGTGIGFTSGSYGNMYLSGAGTFGSVPSAANSAAISGYRTLNSRFTNTAGISVYDPNRGFIRSNANVAGNFLKFEDVTLDTLTITPQMFNSQSNFHGVSMVGIQLIGSDPPNPLIITSVSRDALSGKLTCTWSSNPGMVYLVESSTDLKTWLEVDAAVHSGGDSTSFIYWPDPDPLDSLFLRVREL